MKMGMNFRLTGKSKWGVDAPHRIGLYMFYRNNKETESKMIYLLLIVIFAPFIVLGFGALSMACDNCKYRNKVSVESVNKTYGVGV